MNGGSIRYIVLNGYLRVCGKADEALHYADTYDILTYVFEPIEDNNIDIDSIEELKLSEYDREHYVAPIRHNTDKINELIRAIKQINKKLKEKE